MNVNPLDTERLPTEGRMPAFDGADQWLNSPPLTSGDLQGKVVLVQFWTYTCINWLRTLPYVRGWAEAYGPDGLVVIGVHTPEYSFEHDIDNVRRAVREMRVGYPVATDNEYAVWHAFDNHYWPALYFVDARGEIRHHQFGEGDAERSERIVRQLLADAGHAVHRDLVAVEPRGAELGADWDSLQSPETYLGYSRGERFASLGGSGFDQRHEYSIPPDLSLNQWALGGTWTVGPEAATLVEAGGRLAFRFHARDLHLIMIPRAQGTPARFRVTLDGRSPGAGHGLDVDDQGNGIVDEPRMYQLIRQREPIADRTFEIEFLDPGAKACAFTFG